MAHFERIRDVISGPFSPEVMRQRTAAGWQLVSLEWRRELPESEAPSTGAFAEDIPYGLRISDDCQRLEIDPNENRVLMIMMELLVQDFPYSSIVSDLNEKGLRMRDGFHRVHVRTECGLGPFQAHCKQGEEKQRKKRLPRRLESTAAT